MWDKFWTWLIESHVFHAAMAICFLYIVIFPIMRKGAFSKIKKVKAGPTGIELEAVDANIDPATPCPYVKSRDVTFAELRNLKENVSELKKEVDEIMAIVKNMSIDQQKSSFYDERQPDAERLAAGLKYLYQGGNGHTKKDVIAFAENHKDIYNALTYVKPELRLIYGEVKK